MPQRTWIRLLSFGLLLSAGLDAQELANSKQRGALERVAIDLVRGGHRSVIKPVRRVLRNLGASAQQLARFDKRCVTPRSARRKPRPIRKTVATKLRRIAGELAESLPKLSAERRTDLAYEIVAIDHANSAARKALGHELIDGRWLDDEQKTRTRRTEMLRKAVLEARDFEPEITIRACEHSVYRELRLGKGIALSHKKLSLVCQLPKRRAEQLFRQSLRASWLLNWMLTGKKGIFDEQRAVTWVIVPGEVQYLAALQNANRARSVSKATQENGHTWTQFFDRRGWFVQRYLGDDYTEILLFTDIAVRLGLPPFFEAGLSNWVCETMLGRPLASAALRSPTSLKHDFGSMHKQTFVRIGLARRLDWIDLLRKGENIPVVDCFFDEAAKVRGPMLVKCTLVAEKLFLDTPIAELKAAFKPGLKKSGVAFVPVFEEALGVSLVDFESDWTSWLSGSTQSLVELTTPTEAADTKRARRALGHLASIRRRVYEQEMRKRSEDNENLTARSSLRLSSELAAQSARLAEQLSAKPMPGEELAAWPTRPTGAWTPSRPIVAYGVSDPVDAVDRLLCDPVARTQLLSPELERVGWGEKRGVLVLDASTFAAPANLYWALAWPCHGVRGVPRSAAQAQRVLVKGHENKKLGYPITLNLGRAVLALEGFGIEIEFRKGNREGERVDCWESTPSSATQRRSPPALHLDAHPQADSGERPALRGDRAHEGRTRDRVDLALRYVATMFVATRPPRLTSYGCSRGHRDSAAR